MTRVTTYQAAAVPADECEEGGGDAEQTVFERERRKQPLPRGAERLQDHRILPPLAVSGGERAAKHQHRDDERQRRRHPNGQR